MWLTLSNALLQSQEDSAISVAACSASSSAFISWIVASLHPLFLRYAFCALCRRLYFSSKGQTFLTCIPFQSFLSTSISDSGLRSLTVTLVGTFGMGVSHFQAQCCGEDPSAWIDVSRL